jgi:hypothetical protein
MVREKSHLAGISRLSINGIRQHFLRFRIPETWRCQEEANLKYDSTLGFYSTNGFRAGCCLAFDPYDLLMNREIPLLEIPLVLMDRSYTKYRRARFEEMESDITGILNCIRQHRGIGSILWHSHVHDEFGLKNADRIYSSILQYLKDFDAYTPGMSEYCQWYSRRLRVTPVYEGICGEKHQWRITTGDDVGEFFIDVASHDRDIFGIESSHKIQELRNRGKGRVTLQIQELEPCEVVIVRI